VVGEFGGGRIFSAGGRPLDPTGDRETWRHRVLMDGPAHCSHTLVRHLAAACEVERRERGRCSCSLLGCG
jgi:hypothetical protein